jgi:putative ABC transport system permease protein/lipoprotein-releasing system permease protein
MESSAFFTNVKTVFGRFPFIVIGVSDEDRDYLMQRVGTSLLPGGRMPANGMPEAVLSQPIADNKHVKIGDIIAGPDDENGVSGSPIPVRLVGILKGPIWIGFSSKSFCDRTFVFSPRSTVFTTKNPGDLMALNDLLMPTKHKSAGKLNTAKVQLYSYQNLIKDLQDSLSSMYLIMGVVNGMVIFVIALMSGMLSNIYFTQRLAEFAVLAAIGYQRKALILRIVGETLLLTLAGWVSGGIVTMIALSIMKSTLFEPRGLIIDPFDLFAYTYTLPIPVCLTVFAVATIAVRLIRLDPVTIIERR